MTQAFNLSQLANNVNTSGQLDLSTGVTGTLATSNLPTIPVSKGGTNLTSTPTNGQILIGNGTGYTLATLTAGSNITITNSAGGITINAAAGGMTVLGTITTTSGSSATLSGLNLTGYKQIQCQLNGVSTTGTSVFVQLNGNTIINVSNSSYNFYGTILIDLTTGYYTSIASRAATSSANDIYVANSGLTTSSTSITFTVSGGASFDAGSILVYGIK